MGVVCSIFYYLLPIDHLCVEYTTDRLYSQFSKTNIDMVITFFSFKQLVTESTVSCVALCRGTVNGFKTMLLLSSQFFYMSILNV